MNRLLIFGLGYSGTAIAEAALAAGFQVSGTTRSGTTRPDIARSGTRGTAGIGTSGTADAGGPGTAGSGIPGILPFDSAETAIATATHILTTAAPDSHGDPVLARYAPALEASRTLRWIGYLSSTVVYGNRDGAWVDEDTPVSPSNGRGQRRVAAEEAWSRFADRRAVDIFRLAGIYGPGRSAFDDLRANRARRLIKPGHQFGRIHRDDIARAVLAAMRQDPRPGRRIFNLADDSPSESAAVVTEAAGLLGIDPPEAVRFEDAEPIMSPMARSFWSENRKIASAKTKAVLGVEWLYPSYREGLRAILQQGG